MSEPTPHALWLQARDEHPHDEKRQRARYIELMRENGHLIPKDNPKVRLRQIEQTLSDAQRRLRGKQ